MHPATVLHHTLTMKIKNAAGVSKIIRITMMVMVNKGTIIAVFYIGIILTSYLLFK